MGACSAEPEGLHGERGTFAAQSHESAGYAEAGLTLGLLGSRQAGGRGPLRTAIRSSCDPLTDARQGC